MGAILVRRMLGLDNRWGDAARSVAPTESIVALIAGLSFVAGLIHIGASIAHFSALPYFATAFALVAALQICWAGWLTRRPSRSAMVTGLVANVAVVALWVVSLTVSVPLAEQPLSHPHTAYLCFLGAIQGSSGGVNIGVALTAILPELVIAIAVAVVLAQTRSTLAERVVPRLAPALLAAMFLSVLYGVGGG